MKIPFLFELLSCRRLSSTLVNVPMQMKHLNERKQFVKVISLYDEHVQRKKATAMMTSEALNACVASSDFKRGLEIHQSLADRLLANPFIQVALIRLYSKLFVLAFLLVYLQFSI